MKSDNAFLRLEEFYAAVEPIPFASSFNFDFVA